MGKLWVYETSLKTGSAYSFTWFVDGKAVGGANDLPAFTEDSYPKPGVPQGKVVGPIVLTSKIYPDMKTNMWYYVPAQYDGSTAVPVQIWGDGQFYTVPRPSAYRLLDTLDNLTAQKKIPVMINVFPCSRAPDRTGRRCARSNTTRSMTATPISSRMKSCRKLART